MTVTHMAKQLNLEVLSLQQPSVEIDGVYAGDLLSWVMSHARKNNVWVTIMTNPNIIAVATLVGVSCIIIAENAAIDENVIRTAKEREINLFRSPESICALCASLTSHLS